MIASCEGYKAIFLNPEVWEPYQILALTAPQNLTVWTKKDTVWNTIFYIYVALLAAAFLLVGFLSIFLLIKKDYVRLQSKIFVTIYTCIAILCLSRATWLSLDPLGLIGFIGEAFNGWFVVSRTIEALGFPSLDASYTLIIVALLKISAKPGEPWHYQWKIILSVVTVIYTVVFGALIIAFTAPYPGVIAVPICQYLFVIKGLVICVMFLLGGTRLLRKLNRSETKSVRLSDMSSNPLNTQHSEHTTFANKELQRRKSKTKRTKRKIITITYATVVFSIIYSLISAAQAALTTYLFYGSCFGYQEVQAPSSAWLVLEISQRVTEVVLALVLLYSITDLTAVMKTVCRSRQ